MTINQWRLLNKKSNPNHWFCKDCGKDTYIDEKDYYMVTEKIWKKFGLNGRGMLCMNCMELRLGRKLIKTDLRKCDLNNWNYYTQKILNEGIR